MESKSNFAVAVLVPAGTTIDTVDVQLAGPMRTLMPSVIDSYRLGGEFTGAWDPHYEPRTDPQNWRPCTPLLRHRRTPANPAPSAPTLHRTAAGQELSLLTRRTGHLIPATSSR